MSRSVCVVGSVNMDLVVQAPRFGRPGETLLGDSFEMHPGGKGANQAVAASRMGADVSLVGCVGDDEWGSQMRGVLAGAGIDLHHVRTGEKTHTGVGVVTVVPGGDNAIVVVPGANGLLGPDDVDQATKTITGSDVLVLQSEVSVEANLRAVEIASRRETMIVLNAAPATQLPNELLKHVHLLVVNREEARVLVGDEQGEIAPSGLARRLASLGPERVVVTLGSEGAVHFNGQKVRTFEALPVEAVDSTAAGDAFVGALAVLRAETARLEDAVRYACAAGALACTVEGAIPSLPTREAVEALLNESKSPA